MKRILLIAPAFETGFRLIQDKMVGKRAFLAPLPIATVAALTPPEYEVELWDEAVQGLIAEDTEFGATYDLVGITGYTTQIHRASAIAYEFRRRGVLIAIGGPAASVAPEIYSQMADFTFIGEAEHTWPQFLKDWENGTPRQFYRQVLKPDLADSPLPRWDLLKTDFSPYLLGAVQDSRGCPYDCEFCDVPYLFGHRMRYRPVSTICQEIDMQRRMGAEGVFLCNDNFIGDLKAARHMLKELVQLNSTFPQPVSFYTDLTLNVAKHDDVLELLADANFGSLFIGIETPNTESLKETHKVQNLYRDIVQDALKVQSYGMPITSGIVVGFDHDTVSVFDQQFEFIQAACIPIPMIQMLCAPHGTRLRARLQAEGRLLAGDENPTHRPTPQQHDFLAMNTNIIPKSMTRVELLQGYLGLQERVRDWTNFAARIKGFVSGVKRRPKVKDVDIPADGLQKLNAFLKTLDDDARKTVTEMIQYTMGAAPYLLTKVVRLAAMNYREKLRLNNVRPHLLKRIEMESAPGYSVEVDRMPSNSVNGDFVQIYNTLLPEVYQEVRQSLRDKTRAEDITVGVFGEFLSQRQDSPDGSALTLEAARPELMAVCASVVDAENSVSQIAVDSTDNTKSKLTEDIFNHIERDAKLRRSLREQSG